MEKEPSTGVDKDLWDNTASTLAPSIISTSPTVTTTYPSPAYTTKNPPTSSDFHTLIATNSNFVNIVLSPPSTPETPLFYITNSQWSRSKPSVAISRSSKSGPVLGVLKLGRRAENMYGLGDPQKEEEGGEPVRWEGLRRTSKWTHGTYEFVFQGRSFVWQRTAQPIFSDQPDLECKEVGGSEVLAVYIGSLRWKKRGMFYLRKGGEGVGGSAGGESKEDDVWGDWEIAVLLTGLGIIEGSRRRARQRRAAGGGG